ncbi:MAG TPA: glycosyl hydrolase family 18 protein [Candidatus Paceibacterota bacterium]|nr:glycosyl hydrolase family 18 protein [Candidatus Paceibacterota bacterium]
MKKKLYAAGTLAAAFLLLSAWAAPTVERASAAASATSTPLADSATTVSTAQKPLVYGAWLPFWQSQPGQEDIALHLENMDEVSPFSYEIGAGGSLIDDLNINNGSWDGWLSAVRELNVKIIPTIAWFNASGIYNLLSKTKSRQAEEDNVTALVKANKFDGIDIDFEGMSPKTRPYYSLFIQGLAMRLHPAGKKLTCTVVPRTPPDRLYTDVPANIVYPENYTVLNQYCDEVRLMTYDQQTVDLVLNAEKGNGSLYAPVADPAWVTVVLKNALNYISPKKIMLGVPTYGYEYEVSWVGGETTYQRVRSFDYFGAMDRADALGIEPVRNNAGELSFTFTSSTYIAEPAILVTTVPSAEPLALTAPNPQSLTTFFVSFPDAQSVADKIALARKYNLKGVMLFKADGGMDPAIWSEMN